MQKYKKDSTYVTFLILFFRMIAIFMITLLRRRQLLYQKPTRIITYTTEYQQVLATPYFTVLLELFISAMRIGYTQLLGMPMHIVIRGQNKTVTTVM